MKAHQSPDAQALLAAWTPFKQAMGVTSVSSPEEYERAMPLMDCLLEEVGGDEDHPLAELLDYLANQVLRWEQEHAALPESAPREVLRLLMEQHGLKQEDLGDCAPQGRISDILSGRRAISRQTAKLLARRFKVHADLFL